jgi:RNA polymerase sigma factor (sigma-70 family)
MSHTGESIPSASPSVRNATPTSVRLARARDGDRSALGRLLLEQQWWLVRGAGRLLPQRMRVSPSEIVARVYLQAIKGVAKFRGSDRPTFRAWLKRILIGVTNRVKRKHFVREVSFANAPDPPDPRTPVEDGVAKRERIEWMSRAMGYLEDRDQQILRQHYFDDLTFEQIAVRLDQGTSAAALRKQAERLRERLGRGILLLTWMDGRGWPPIRSQALGLWCLRAWSPGRVARELVIPEAAVQDWIKKIPTRLVESPDPGDLM